MKNILFIFAAALLAATGTAQTFQRFAPTRSVLMADTTPPTLTGATIPLAGTSITLAFSEAVTFGAGGNAGWTPTLTGGASAMTYASGSGTSSLVYNLGRTVLTGETGTLAYTQPGAGVTDISANNLATLSSFTITNNSTASGGADTLKDSNTATSTGIDDVIGSFSATTYSSGWFTASATYTMHRLDMPVKKTGSPTFNVSVAIYSDNSGAPGTLISESSQVVSSTFSASETKITFTGLSANITSSTKYWIVFHAYSSPNDFTNYGNFSRSSGGASDNTKISSDGSSWSTNNTFSLVRFEAYGS